MLCALSFLLIFEGYEDWCCVYGEQILEEHIEWNGASRRRTLRYYVAILTEHHLMLECQLHVKLHCNIHKTGSFPFSMLTECISPPINHS